MYIYSINRTNKFEYIYIPFEITMLHARIYTYDDKLFGQTLLTKIILRYHRE